MTRWLAQLLLGAALLTVAAIPAEAQNTRRDQDRRSDARWESRDDDSDSDSDSDRRRGRWDRRSPGGWLDVILGGDRRTDRRADRRSELDRAHEEWHRRNDHRRRDREWHRQHQELHDRLERARRR
jgi:hypothetical protein